MVPEPAQSPGSAGGSTNSSSGDNTTMIIHNETAKTSWLRYKGLDQEGVRKLQLLGVDLVGEMAISP